MTAVMEIMQLHGMMWKKYIAEIRAGTFEQSFPVFLVRELIKSKHMDDRLKETDSINSDVLNKLYQFASESNNYTVTDLIDDFTKKVEAERSDDQLRHPGNVKTT